jgi:hypothetical protein
MASNFACWSSFTIVSEAPLVGGAGCTIDVLGEDGVGEDEEGEDEVDEDGVGEDEVDEDI